jgi:hypothetical protein
MIRFDILTGYTHFICTKVGNYCFGADKLILYDVMKYLLMFKSHCRSINKAKRKMLLRKIIDTQIHSHNNRVHIAQLRIVYYGKESFFLYIHVCSLIILSVVYAY